MLLPMSHHKLWDLVGDDDNIGVWFVVCDGWWDERWWLGVLALVATWRRGSKSGTLGYIGDKCDFIASRIFDLAHTVQSNPQLILHVAPPWFHQTSSYLQLCLKVSYIALLFQRGCVCLQNTLAFLSTPCKMLHRSQREYLKILSRLGSTKLSRVNMPGRHRVISEHF